MRHQTSPRGKLVNRDRYQVITGCFRAGAYAVARVLAPVYWDALQGGRGELKNYSTNVELMI